MKALTDVLHENPLAATFGGMGLFCQLIWPLFRQRRAMLGAQFGIGADYSAQYAFLGAWSGAGVAGLGAMQTALAFAAGERPWLRHAGFAFLPIVAALGAATWNGLDTMLALIAVTLIMVGRLQRDTLRLRIFLLAAAPFGIGYDILVGAMPALIGGLLSASVAARSGAGGPGRGAGGRGGGAPGRGGGRGAARGGGAGPARAGRAAGAGAGSAPGGGPPPAAAAALAPVPPAWGHAGAVPLVRQ